mmetsp:Transcript_10912/g.16090  ORF Transcript_10912/g.16090 Transcript_10912/m.16090 type:complete len:262 (-) Transcript_10912:261-1046(-)|eukprot:CAMPEP_0194251056 /NCGR_PEP_ID=MMETSP0158-20130606/24475_1 /TAXON_ID=33649 /ORGANISM="Thalassionema nitzschioides, Strain L26-B" /LENGTH=261 /DNA_ID=CAMNT_0038988059 /DNA_START=33 /DNA_END=818 /DNA_ORIENTATION=+
MSQTSNAIEGFKKLDKWKESPDAQVPQHFVYEHNRKRASNMGFPSRFQVGLSLNLTEHQVAAVFGWTTGDYRFLNPIARGQQQVEFEDYPFLPSNLTKMTFRLDRDDVLPYVNVLESALLKLTSSIPRKQRLWRGHRRLVSRDLGSTVVLNGFTSATRDREKALSFVEKADEGKSNQRTLLAFDYHFSSRCISRISARRDEMEVLFPIDSTFEVVKAPEHDLEHDLEVVEAAITRFQKTMPNAKINLLYLKEVERSKNHAH